MDPLTALSLAAAAAQFIELAAKVIHRLSDFSADLDQTPKAFRQIKTELPLIVDGLRRIDERNREGSLDPQSRAVLYSVIEECQELVAQLNALLDKILPPPSASSWERKWKAIASLNSDAKIEELAKSLAKYIQVITFHQVVAPASRIESAVLVRKAEPRWLVPFDRNPSFVGRQEIFKAIEATFNVEEGVQPKAALWGLGGIGKSQIALEYCHRLRQSNAACSIFWVNAATVSRFEESYGRIAVECGLVRREDLARRQSTESNGSDAISTVQSWLQTTHNEPWMMVIDNVDDRDAFFRDKLPNGNTPSQCVPHCAQGSLLFTTRSRDVAFDLATPVEPITIPQMSKQEGLQLVKQRLQLSSAPLDDKAVCDLLDELEYIPLAITQAVAFISKRRKTIAQYLEQYRKSDATKMRMLTFEFTEHGRQMNSLESVAKTWSVSFDWIRHNSQRAADILCMVSFLQPQAIPRQLLVGPKGGTVSGVVAGDDEKDGFEFEEALETLCDFSLLDSDSSADVFSTHHFVQLVTRWWLQSEGPEEKQKWALAALQSVASSFPVGDTMGAAYFSLCESLFPHAELLLSYEFGPQQLPDHQRTIDLARAQLLVTTGHYLVWTSAFDEALARMEKSITLRRQHLGEKHVDTLASMGQVAWFHSLIIIDPTRAIPFGRRVLALRTELLGPDHEQTIDSMADLAGALQEAGGLEESETLLREAIERGTRTLGPNSLMMLNCMSILAFTLKDQGKLIETAELQRLVFEKKRETLGPQNIQVLIAETNLATTLTETDEKREEGKALMRNVIRVKQRTLGYDHRETLVATYNLAVVLHNDGALQEALELCEIAVAACEEGPRRGNQHSDEFVEKLKGIAQSARDVLEDVE